MRIALDLPDKLLNEAMKVSGSRTRNEAIITALEELVHNRKVAELKTFKGKVDLVVDLDAVRGRQRLSKLT